MYVCGLSVIEVRSVLTTLRLISPRSALIAHLFVASAPSNAASRPRPPRRRPPRRRENTLRSTRDPRRRLHKDSAFRGFSIRRSCTQRNFPSGPEALAHRERFRSVIIITCEEVLRKYRASPSKRVDSRIFPKTLGNDDRRRKEFVRSQYYRVRISVLFIEK